MHKIVKNSRGDSSRPYRGPACKNAGVEPGKVYQNLKEAEEDARRLSNVNPVGFRVVEMK